MFFIKKLWSIIAGISEGPMRSLGLFALGLSVSLWNLATNQTTLFTDEVNSTLTQELISKNLLDIGLRSRIQLSLIRLDFWQAYFFPVLRDQVNFDLLVFINRLPAALSMALSVLVLDKIFKVVGLSKTLRFIGVLVYVGSAFYLLQSHFLSLIGFYVLYGFSFIYFLLKFLYQSKHLKINLFLAFLFAGLCTYTHVLSLPFLIIFTTLMTGLNFNKLKSSGFFKTLISWKILGYYAFFVVAFFALVFPTINDVFLQPREFAQAKQSHTFLSYFSAEPDIYTRIPVEIINRTVTYFRPEFLVVPGTLNPDSRVEDNIYIFANISNANDNKWITEVVAPFGVLGALVYPGLVIALFLTFVMEKRSKEALWKLEHLIIASFVSYLGLAILPNYGNPSLSKLGPASIFIVSSIVYIFALIWSFKGKLKILGREIPKFSIFVKAAVCFFLIANLVMSVGYVNSKEYNLNELDKFDYGYRQAAEEILKNNLLMSKPTIIFKDNLWSKEKHLEYYLGPSILENIVRIGGETTIDKSIVRKDRPYILITKYAKDEIDLKENNFRYTWKSFKQSADQQKVVHMAIIGDFIKTTNPIEIYSQSIPTVLQNYSQFTRVSDYNLAPSGYLAPQQEFAKFNSSLVPETFKTDPNVNAKYEVIQPLFDFQTTTAGSGFAQQKLNLEAIKKTGNFTLWKNNTLKQFTINTSITNECTLSTNLIDNSPVINISKRTGSLPMMYSSLILDSESCQDKSKVLLIVGDQVFSVDNLLKEPVDVDFSSTKFSIENIGFYKVADSQRVDLNNSFNVKVENCGARDSDIQYELNQVPEQYNGLNVLALKSIVGISCLSAKIDLTNESGSQVSQYLVKTNLRNITNFPARTTIQNVKDELVADTVTSTQKSQDWYEQEFLLLDNQYKVYQHVQEGGEKYFTDIQIQELQQYPGSSFQINDILKLPYIPYGGLDDFDLENGVKLNIKESANLVNLENDSVDISECSPYTSDHTPVQNYSVDSEKITMYTKNQVLCAKLRFYNLTDGTYSFSYKYKNTSGFAPSVCVLDKFTNQCLPIKITLPKEKDGDYETFFKIDNAPQIEIIFTNFSGGNLFDSETQNTIYKIKLAKVNADFLHNYVLSNVDLNQLVKQNIDQPTQKIPFKYNKTTNNFFDISQTVEFSTKERFVTIVKYSTYDKNWRLKIGDQDLGSGDLTNNSYMSWTVDLELLKSQKAINASADLYQVKANIFYKP